MQHKFTGLAVAVLVCLALPARADVLLFEATLTGGQQVPPFVTPATGFATVLLDTVADTITVNESWANLSSPATASHIHGPAPLGANAPVLFPFTNVPAVITGSIPEQSFTLTPAQVSDLEAGLYYVNVHDANFPGGEIRGQILGPVAPEPSSLLLMGTGAGGLLGFRWLRRRR